MNLNTNDLLKNAKGFITANSPVLLVGTAVVGIVSTGVLAARAGYKARGIIDEAQEARATYTVEGSPEDPDIITNHGAPLTKVEMAQLTWLCYASPAVTGATSIAAVLGVHAIHNKRHAAMAGLYAVTTSKLDEVRTKAEEMLGTKKAQQLNNELAQASVDKTPFVDNEVIITGKGTEMFYDDLSGRYFTSSMLEIEQAVKKAAVRLAQRGDYDLSDLYDDLGLRTPAGFVNHGWSGDGKQLDVKYGSVSVGDGRACVSVSFHPAPYSLVGLR